MPTIHIGPGERWAFVSALAYTAVGVMLRGAAPTIDPFVGSLLRLLPVWSIAAGVMLARRGLELRPSASEFIGRRQLAALLVAGASSFVVGNVLYFLALSSGGLGMSAGGVQAGSVLGGLWIGLIALGERPRREQLLGAGIIVAGLAGIAIAQTAVLANLWWVGLLLALGAGTTYALANSASRFVQRRRPLLFATLLVSSSGGLIPLTAIVGGRAALGSLGPIDSLSAGAVLAAGLVNAVALAALAQAVRTAPVASVNTISSASIVFSFVAAMALFEETGSLPMIVGIALVTAGIVVAQLRRTAPDSPPAPGAPEASGAPHVSGATPATPP